MAFGISHDWSEETIEAKARWFQSLSPEERMLAQMKLAALDADIEKVGNGR